jgi:hypothetical protein
MANERGWQASRLVRKFRMLSDLEALSENAPARSFGFLSIRSSSCSPFLLIVGSQVASRSGINIVKLNGRCGALHPLFRLVGVRCIAALRRVEKPPASPQQSPVTEFFAANTRSAEVPGKTGGTPESASGPTPNDSRTREPCEATAI